MQFGSQRACNDLHLGNGPLFPLLFFYRKNEKGEERTGELQIFLNISLSIFCVY